MMTIEMFKEACGLTKITTVKGKGREFCETPIGKVFAGSKTDWAKQVFIIKAGEDLLAKDGKSLAGSYWFVNSAVQIMREI